MRFEDGVHEESYQMLRNRERRQVYLHDYGEEYCTTTDYGELVIQQRLHMAHWIIEVSSISRRPPCLCFTTSQHSDRSVMCLMVIVTTLILFWNTRLLIGHSFAWSNLFSLTFFAIALCDVVSVRWNCFCFPCTHIAGFFIVLV